MYVRGMFLDIILAHTIWTDILIHLQNQQIPEELIQHIYEYQMANLKAIQNPNENSVLHK